jgi:hypothetical protein
MGVGETVQNKTNGEMEKILSRPVVTNRHLWLYIAIKNEYLKYEEVQALLDQYRNFPSESVSELCKKANVARNGTTNDLLLRTLRFSYKKSDEELTDEVITDLNRLCGSGELSHQMEFNKDDKTISEKYQATSSGKEHVLVLGKLFSRVLSGKEVREGTVEVYAAESLDGKLKIEIKK